MAGVQRAGDARLHNQHLEAGEAVTTESHARLRLSREVPHQHAKAAERQTVGVPGRMEDRPQIDALTRQIGLHRITVVTDQAEEAGDSPAGVPQCFSQAS